MIWFLFEFEPERTVSICPLGCIWVYQEWSSRNCFSNTLHRSKLYFQSSLPLIEMEPKVHKNQTACFSESYLDNVQEIREAGRVFGMTSSRSLQDWPMWRAISSQGTGSHHECKAWNHKRTGLLMFAETNRMSDSTLMFFFCHGTINPIHPTHKGHEFWYTVSAADKQVHILDSIHTRDIIRAAWLASVFGHSLNWTLSKIQPILDVWIWGREITDTETSHWHGRRCIDYMYTTACLEWISNKKYISSRDIFVRTQCSEPQSCIAPRILISCRFLFGDWDTGSASRIQRVLFTVDPHEGPASGGTQVG